MKPVDTRSRGALRRLPLAAAIVLASQGVLAQGPQLEEIIVTAQKREQNLQDVPISMQSLSNATLTDLNVQDFDDYAKMLPSVSLQQQGGPGYNLVYMRGVATGQDGFATASSPSVGMYLDEQPITTIQGNLDIHMYDIQRVEVLAGPQGTLYGASSQAGTIKIVTNKPDIGEFSAGYGLELNQVDGDDFGGLAEGYVNVPINESAAIRLVGWSRHDAGYIDNVRGRRTFPTSGITIDNKDEIEDNFNDVDVYGARAALRWDINENWTVTPSVMGQKQNANGNFGDDLGDPGDKEVSHYYPEGNEDEWWQAALTVEGKIADFDIVYAGAMMERNVDTDLEYSDYAFWYDNYYTTGYFGNLFVDNNGNYIVPTPTFRLGDEYERESHEIRISSPQDKRLRGLLGFFWQQQDHHYIQQFVAPGLADVMDMNFGRGNNTYPDTVYINQLYRTDRDHAVFGELSYDITEDVTLTGGMRFFNAESQIKGFFGYSLGFSDLSVIGFDPGSYWSRNGEYRCASQEDYRDAPCKNVDADVGETDNIGRVNLSWRIDDERMVYVTWSEGYRPGGINRVPGEDPYVSDFLTNWETGWKTTWFDNALQWNGALFYEEWDDVQVGFTGANNINAVRNGPSAEITGLETDLQWAAAEGLTITASVGFYDSELKGDYCTTDRNKNYPGVIFDSCSSPGDVPADADVTLLAPEGTELPVTADFKGSLIVRYEFPLADYDAHLQWATSYEGDRASDLTIADNDLIGDLDAYSITDLAAGVRNDAWGVELFVKNAFDEDADLFRTAQCEIGVCYQQQYGIIAVPRTVGVRFSQEF